MKRGPSSIQQGQFLRVHGRHWQPPRVSSLAAVTACSVWVVIRILLLARKWVKALWPPYHGTESSEKFGHHRRPRQSRERRGRNRPLLPAARAAGRTGAAAPRDPPIRRQRPQAPALHPPRPRGGP